MNRNFNYDNIIKSTLEESVKDIESSDDIFDKAWRSNESNDKKSSWGFSLFIKKPMIQICAVVVFTMILTATLPVTHTLAKDVYENIRLIFVLEEDNTVVEKTEDMAYDFEHLGSVKINKGNKSLIEKNMGFEFSLPQTIGDSYELQGHSSAGITIFNVTLKDIENNRDVFLNAIEDNTLFKSLNEFVMNRHVMAHYSNSDMGNFNLYINKHKLNLLPKMKVIQTIDLNDEIKCSVVESIRPFYPRKYVDNWVVEDITRKPDKIVKLRYIIWEKENITYSVTSGFWTPDNDKLDIQEALKFIRAYTGISEKGDLDK